MRHLLPSPTRSLSRRTRSTRTRLASLERLEGRELLTSFNFSDFGTTAGLNLVGSAATTADNRLRLTPSVSSTGGAWYVGEKPIVAGNFETTFQFKLSTASGGADGSDGFAFVIQNSSPTELRGGGGALGYDGMPNSVAIEFDTWLNNGTGDPNNDPSQSHISVHTNGTGPNSVNESFRVGSAYNTSGFLLDNAQVHTARLGYTSGTLKVYLDNLTTPVLTVPIDLGTTLALDQGRAWVGFTAAAGGSPLNQDILNWSFSGTDDLILANPSSVIEGAAPGTSALPFTIDRLGSTVGSVAVNWTTANGTATAGTDYVAASGQVVLLDGESQKTVNVTIYGDANVETNETLRLVLSAPVGVSVASGMGTILNDDTSITVNDIQVIEGDSHFGGLGALVPKNGNGGLNLSTGMVFGPDGNLYVGSLNTHEVLRYNAVTGAFMGPFVTAESGGLRAPGLEGLSFRPDGKLYVASRDNSNVLRYDANTGAFLDIFIPSNEGGLQSPKGMIFGTDGNLYISSGATNQVLRYNGSTGAFLDVFVATGSGGLTNPRFLTFGPDGNLYISSSNSDSVLKFNGATGAFISTFIAANSGGLDFPADLLFDSGSLLVASQNTNQVLRYSATTGAFIEATLPATNNGLNQPIGLLLDANSNLLIGSFDEILRYGPASQVAFTVSLSSPSAVAVTVSYATMNGSAATSSDFIAASGTLTFAPGQTTRTILIQTVDDSIGEPTETFTLVLSNPVGGSIADGVGVGTIIDNDPGPTKFYVVDDASANRTYEYGSTGTAVENYVVDTGNTAPRGAASTAAGTTVWVVDANKRVYVYNTSGGLLGSWTAGSLASNAAVEGITTDGTDVWIVDGKADKVFRYSNAAGRLSGTQNAASSFNLFTSPNNPNVDAKDLVTDGQSIWVVDDNASGKIARVPKVFKYSLSGSLLGSWSIGVGANPTGITLDPTGGGALWIVDSGTDLVYQFDAARSLAPGVPWPSPSKSFVLAAGNTNPQGIADPPVGRSIPVVTSRPVVKLTQATRPLHAFAHGPDQVWALPSESPIPAGPRGLRSHLTASRRRP